ncbi:MAG: TIGR03118 family protein [Chitinophagaceae bacterium]
MNKKRQTIVNSLRKKMLLITIAAGVCFGCHKPKPDEQALKDFKVTNLVANTSEYHPVLVDPTLINGFGMAWSAGGIAWVNSVGGHVSELYNAEGGRLRAVNIPSPNDTIGGFPCGIVFSTGKGFNLSPKNPAAFLFTGFDGVLSGWNPASNNNAQRLRAPANASYTGLAIASNGGQNFIYAANFGQKKIDVWDTAFRKINMAFKDPTLPDNYSPYNIQEVGGLLFVVYAILDTRENSPTKGRGIAGAGTGIVSVFNPDGSFKARFAAHGSLNLPWGVTMAQASFLEDQDMNNGGGHGGYESSIEHTASYGNHDPKDPVILIGNFGDGRINVYTQDGQYLGQLQSHKNPITIDGLWALSFPPASANIDAGRLYFTAGPDNENDGVFGYLKKQ